MTELRLYPRLRTQLPVTITGRAGVSVEAIIGNLSRGGLMIAGNLATHELKTSNPPPDPRGRFVEVTIHCTFPNDPQPFRARCRLVFVRRLSQRQFTFGCRFVDLDAAMSARLDAYLAYALRD